MLRHPRLAHMHPDTEIVSTGAWIAHRVLIVAVAVVFVAPFVLAYAG